jgi:hypothetical protein
LARPVPIADSRSLIVSVATGAVMTMPASVPPLPPRRDPSPSAAVSGVRALANGTLSMPQPASVSDARWPPPPE